MKSYEISIPYNWVKVTVSDSDAEVWLRGDHSYHHPLPDGNWELACKPELGNYLTKRDCKVIFRRKPMKLKDLMQALLALNHPECNYGQLIQAVLGW